MTLWQDPTAEELDPELVAEARRQVTRALGSAVERKASDQFCVLSAQSMRAGRPEVFGFEGATATRSALPGMAAAPPTIIEFSSEDTRDRSVFQAPGTPTNERRRAVEAARTRSYQVVGAVYDEVERISTGVLGQSPQTGTAAPVSAVLNQVCWLNRTVRTFAAPVVLADVAHDDAIETIDVPRALRADAWPRNLEAIGIPFERHPETPTGDGVILAVIDSEVALRHPALAGRVVHRRNFTPEGWGNPHAHGTAVAGIMAAADAEHGGIAPEAVIYNYKVLAGGVSAEDFGGAVALQSALEDGAAVANCSWGTGRATNDQNRTVRAVDAAWSLGMVVVKSAGNDGPGLGTMTSPADASGVIVVGATDVTGMHVEPYSSRGPVAQRLGPHVVAPGGSDDARIESSSPSGGFAMTDRPGTSFAAPHVAGLAALASAQNPAWTPDEIRQHVVDRARAIPGEEPESQGAGVARL